MVEMEKQKVRFTRESHNIQTFWQIYLPLLVVLGGIILIAYKLFQATHSGLTDMQVWADISAIWLILPLFLIILLLILITILISALLSQSGDPIRKGFSKLNQISMKLGKVSLSACKAIQKILINTESYTSTIIPKNGSFSKRDQEG